MMKKNLLLCCAFMALSTTAFGQSDPFEWSLGDKTKVKLGGFLRFNVNSDLDGSVGAKPDFQPVNIPTSTSWGAEDYLNFDPTATRFSLQVTQNSEAVGDIKVFVEADFRNAGYAARLRQAYIEMCGVTAGFAWSFMSDLASNAPTVDIMGVNSRTFLRTMMVGYRHSFSDKLSGGIALEVPKLATEYIDDVTVALNQRMPDVPIYLQLKGNAGHIKAAAVLRTLQYGVVATRERHSAIGWGTQLSGSLNLPSDVKLYSQAIYGKGINNYINDLSGLKINTMSTDGETMVATPMGGASLGLTWKFAPKWTVATSGSMVRNFGDDDYFGGNYMDGSYIATTLLYAPAPRVTLGAEYLGGSRTNFGGEANVARRLSLMVKYTL